MKKIAFLLVIFAASTASAYPQVLNEILKRMDTHQKALNSLRADLTINKFSLQFGGTFTKEGALKYLPVKNKPPVLRIDSTKPAPESFLIVGNQSVGYLPDQKTAYIGLASNDGINLLLLFLSMPGANLKADYTLRNIGEEKAGGTIPAWHLELTPKTAGDYKTIELWIDGNGMPVQAKLIENNGDWTSVLFGNLQKNVVFNASEFKVNLPKGTKIVKD